MMDMMFDISVHENLTRNILNVLYKKDEISYSYERFLHPGFITKSQITMSNNFKTSQKMSPHFLTDY